MAQIPYLFYACIIYLLVLCVPTKCSKSFFTLFSNIKFLLYKIFHHLLITYILFFLATMRSLTLVPCTKRADYPKNMCEFPKIVWCFDGYCECVVS